MKKFLIHQKWQLHDPRKLKADILLTSMICTDFQPFSIVEDEGFKKFINYLEPNYSMPTRRMLRENVVPEMYESVVGTVETKLSTLEAIGLTTDHWTSRANDSYMSVTAHGLTKNFDVIDVCLDVKHMPISHTGENIAKALMDTVENGCRCTKRKNCMLFLTTLLTFEAHVSHYPINFIIEAAHFIRFN